MYLRVQNEDFYKNYKSINMVKLIFKRLVNYKLNKEFINIDKRIIIMMGILKLSMMLIKKLNDKELSEIVYQKFIDTVYSKIINEFIYYVNENDKEILEKYLIEIGTIAQKTIVWEV